MTKISTIKNKYFYILSYKDNKNNFHYNLEIDFVDIFKNNNSNQSYIAFIEKTKDFSGSELVKISILVN
jgi:hypothetical protein